MALLDRTLQFNLTGFWPNLDDLYVQGFNAALARFILDNAGRLRRRGVEAELAYTSVKRLNLSLNGAYTEATIRSYFGQCYPGQTAAQGCTGIGGQAREDLSGARVPNAPRWAVSASAGYEEPLGGAVRLFLGSTLSYRSSVNFSLNQDLNTVQPGYTIVNANIGIGASTGGWPPPRSPAIRSIEISPRLFLRHRLMAARQPVAVARSSPIKPSASPASSWM